MEILAKMINKPIGEVTREDLLEIRSYQIFNEDSNSIPSFKEIGSKNCSAYKNKFSSTAVSDLTPLANLQQLNALSIPYTEVTSIKPLLGLKNLNHIVLNKNMVSDWELLKEIPELLIIDW